MSVNRYVSIYKAMFIPVQVLLIYTHIEQTLINSPDKAKKDTCLVREHKEISHFVRAALALQSQVPSCNKDTHEHTDKMKVLQDFKS